MDHEIRNREEIIKQNSSDLSDVALEIATSENPLNIEEKSTEIGENDDSEVRNGDSLNLVASDVVGNENPSYLVTSETLNEMKSAERRCSNGKDDDFEDIGENSSNPVDFETSSENSSNSVTSKTTNEVISAEIRCSTGKDEDDLEDIGENSSNPAALETVIEVRCTETESLASENRVSKSTTDLLEGKEIPADKMNVNIPDPVTGPCVVIDIKGGDGGLDSGNCDGEKVCRICHLSSDHQSDASDLFSLGCNCKDELGVAHRHCAEAWFKLKGNRWCEICGESAKNITGVGDDRFMEEWNDRRILGIISSSPSERSRCWRVQPFCNFVMACLVIAFILPWFFRVNML